MTTEATGAKAPRGHMTREHPIQTLALTILIAMTGALAGYAVFHAGAAHGATMVASGTAYDASPPPIVVTQAVSSTADPSAVAQAATGNGWSLVVQYGPMWAGMLMLLSIGQLMLKENEKKHWLAQGRTLALISGSLAVLGAAAQWHFNGGTFDGVFVTLFSAIAMVWHPTITPIASSSRAASGAKATTVVLVMMLGGMAVSQTACATLSARAAAGAGAFIDCEAKHFDATLLADAISLAKAAVQRWIGGDGHVDASGLKADAAPIKSDLGRCAFAAAIAAATAPAPTSVGAPASAPLEVDAAGLRVAFAEIKASWGVAAVQTSSGVL